MQVIVSMTLGNNLRAEGGAVGKAMFSVESKNPHPTADELSLQVIAALPQLTRLAMNDWSEKVVMKDVNDDGHFTSGQGAD